MSATPTGDGGGRGRGRLIGESGLSTAPGCGEVHVSWVSGANVETKGVICLGGKGEASRRFGGRLSAVRDGIGGACGV